MNIDVYSDRAKQAIQSARNAGRNDAQRERDEAAKRKEQES